jgi:small acid-soluble spore protein D (minor alpha/beta-type SASP)
VAQLAQGTGQKVLPANLLDQFKFEVADELGIQLRRGDNGDMTTREAGRIGGVIGGRMVKVMIRYAEEALRDGRQP